MPSSLRDGPSPDALAARDRHAAGSLEGVGLLFEAEHEKPLACADALAIGQPANGALDTDKRLVEGGVLGFQPCEASVERVSRVPGGGVMDAA
jgi:hypothetical protein